MRQFQVPQFITVEDTIVGPLTIKQFVYIGFGGLLIGIAYKLTSGIVFFLVAPLIGAIAGCLAFLKIHDQPLPKILKNGLRYLTRPRLYVWKHTKAKKETATPLVPKSAETLAGTIPKLSESKLSDLAWSLDIKEKTK